MAATKSGFTLAEVLITLMIIGLVASMTIPTMMNNIQTTDMITRLKKSYSIMAQASKLAIQDNGSVDGWGLVSSGSPTGAVNIYNKLAPYLKVLKYCGTNTGCFATSYNKLNGTSVDVDIDTDTDTAKFMLDDGSSIDIWSWGNCNTNASSSPMLKNICAEFDIDINGAKGPNIFGKDVFYFYLSKNNGIVPAGTAAENGGYTSFSADCKNMSALDSGWGCTGWALYNENEDYSKCTNLSWTGPTKCP